MAIIWLGANVVSAHLVHTYRNKIPKDVYYDVQQEEFLIIYLIPVSHFANKIFNGMVDNVFV